MNLAVLLAFLTLTLTDATGDAIGDGTLDPPTAPIYANAALFDLQGVELEVAETGEAVLRVTLGAISGSGGAPGAATSTAEGGTSEGAAPEGVADDAASADDAGAADPASTDGVAPADMIEGADQVPEPVFESFDPAALLAIVDVYLDSGPGGATSTMEGPNMLMPLGVGWNHAVRLSAAGAQAITYVGTGPLEPDESSARLPTAEPVMVPSDPAEEPAAAEPAPEAEADAAVDGTDPAEVSAADEGVVGDAAPTLQELVPVPLEVRRRGNVLEMRLPWQLDPEATIDVYGMVGVHDPFSPHGWRQLAEAPSPWAFSGSEQVTPVIDLLADSAEVQSDALRRGVLPMPPREPGMSLPLSPWLWMMIGGLALALLGLVMRGRVPGAAARTTDEAPVEDDGSGPAVGGGDGQPQPEPDADEDDPQPAEEPVEVPLEEDPRELPLPADDEDEVGTEPVEEPTSRSQSEGLEEGEENEDEAAESADEGPDVDADRTPELDEGSDHDRDDGTDRGSGEGDGDGDAVSDEAPAPPEEPTEVPLGPSQAHEAAAEGAAAVGSTISGSNPRGNARAAERTLGAVNAFDPVVGRSFLEDEDGGFGAGAESDESFWHPSSRGRRNGASAEPEEN